MLEVEKPGDVKINSKISQKNLNNPNMMDIDMLCNNDLDVFVNRLFRMNRENSNNNHNNNDGNNPSNNH
jgi:hypothetical protein